MSGTVAVIGLGEIGASVAIAFRKKETPCIVIGNDYDRTAEKKAETNQWVDRAEHNLFDAVRDADTVILAIPADQTKETLELLGGDLKKDAVILDFCPDKTAAAGWARQYLREPGNFLGVWAGINPQYLGESSCGAGSAHPDLFGKSVLFAAADTGTSESAIRTVSEMAEMLGMECSFAEPLELDGMIAAVYQFPALASGALLNCLTKRTGWRDGKKAAGKVFYSMTAPAAMQMDLKEYGTALLKNRENTVRILNEYIQELISCRDILQGRDETALSALIDENKKIREQWEKEYRISNLSAERSGGPVSPGASEMVNQTFFGGLLRKKNRN